MPARLAAWGARISHLRPHHDEVLQCSQHICVFGSFDALPAGRLFQFCLRCTSERDINSSHVFAKALFAPSRTDLEVDNVRSTCEFMSCLNLKSSDMFLEHRGIKWRIVSRSTLRHKLLMPLLQCRVHKHLGKDV